MHVARVEEQLGLVGGGVQLAGGVEVALPGEERVGVHAVDLTGTPSGHARRTPDREAGVEQQRAPCLGAGLGELLGGHHAHRETGVDEHPHGRLGGGNAPLEQHTESDLTGMGHALVHRGEGPAVEQVRRVDGVP